MVMVITSVIGVFGWVHLIWLANVTVHLQVSDYNPTKWLVKNKAVNTPIKIEEIVMAGYDFSLVMITMEKVTYLCLYLTFMFSNSLHFFPVVLSSLQQSRIF